LVRRRHGSESQIDVLFPRELETHVVSAGITLMRKQKASLFKAAHKKYRCNTLRRAQD